jgi:hypothetical protein
MKKSNLLIFIIIALILVIGFFLIFFLPRFTGKVVEESHNFQDLKLNVSEFVKTYNNNLDKVPRIVIKLFGNENVDLYLDNKLYYGVSMSKGKIIQTREKGIKNPTMNVYVSFETANKLIDKEIGIEEALKTGLIKYKGIGAIKKVKFGVIGFFQKFFIK